MPTTEEIAAGLRAPLDRARALAVIGAQANGTPENSDGRPDEGTGRTTGTRDAAPAPPGDGGDAASHGLLLRTADVRSVRRENRPHPVTRQARSLVVAEWVASTESVDTYDSILACDWDQGGRLDRFKRNPVLLWAHNRESIMRPAIGHCENVRVENNELLLTVVCDDTTEFDREIAEKIEKGVIRAGSVGFGWGEAKLRTIGDLEVVVFSKNELREFSICNVGSNPDSLAQRALVSVAREMARAHGSVAMHDVVAAYREQARVAARTPSLPAAPAQHQDDRAPAPREPRATGDTTMPTPTKKTLHLEARDIRATDDGLVALTGCPHCEAPIEIDARSIPMPTNRARENEALANLARTTESKATDLEGKLTRETAEREAAEKRATALDARLATAESAVRALTEQRVHAEIDKRVGVRIEASEREDQIRLALLDLANTAPDPEKPTRTLGDKAFEARLAKLDARRDLGLLGPPITGADQGKNTGARAGADSQTRSIAADVDAQLAAQAN